MTEILPDFLITYMLKRDAQRADAVNAVLGALTTRERALITNAAVMGYVQGVRHPEGERIPKNDPVLAQVIDACLAFPDLYPAINGVAQATVENHETVEYFVQCQQPDGTWAQASSTSTDLAYATEQLARHREHQPEYTFRLADRHTTVVVHLLPDADDEEPV